MSQMIEIRSVKSRKDLMNFIKFPWRIYENDPNWVPPLIMDRMKVLDRKRNPFFKHNPAKFFLAYENDNMVGRIAAIVNKQHNKYHGDKTGFFGFLEAIDNLAVFETLINAAKDWLRKQGRDRIFGPMNPSTNGEVGFLIDGFDSPPFFMMPHNPPYYNEMMQILGFEKIKDLYAYYLDENLLRNHKKLQRASDTVLQNFPVSMRTINLKNFKQELEIVRKIYNDAWSQNWGFVPLAQEEFDFIANDFKKVIDPELVLIAEYNDEPVGFLMAIPNYNQIFSKIRSGKLLPFGWLTFLVNKKRIKGIRGVTFGIKQKYQHIGMGAIYYVETLRQAAKKGYDHVEISWVLEDNQKIHGYIRLVGGQVYKTYRIYGMSL